MKLSARNQIPATVTSINAGEAIANVELNAGGVRLVAMETGAMPSAPWTSEPVPKSVQQGNKQRVILVRCEAVHLLDENVARLPDNVASRRKLAQGGPEFAALAGELRQIRKLFDLPLLEQRDERFEGTRKHHRSNVPQADARMTISTTRCWS